MKKKIYLYMLIGMFSNQNYAQLATLEDSLRGSLNKNRTWWDVVHYNLMVTPNIGQKTIQGSVDITYKVIAKGKTMQIDLQQPLKVVSVTYKNTSLTFKRSKNIFLIEFPSEPAVNSIEKISISYEGTPVEAKNAPWDGGLVWKKDKNGNDWVNTACQGLGASVWWPCKDHQSDEPENGMTMHFTVPENLVAVGNGRLQNVSTQNGTKTYTWNVTQPINNYNATMNIGKYVNFKDTLNGEKGILDMDYWVLDYNLEKAKKQFEQAKHTIRAFEYWFGPYPFYEDSYKLVETNHLGMEHQSAVAYGNKYQNGYLGRDLSGSGWGLKFDFIIVHESGHEWFGNNITTNDIADMWVHEGFTNYSETLFAQYHYGTEAGNEYVRGTRANIRNDEPIIGKYGVNKEGSGDMYYKGGNCIHTVRTLINDDQLFRAILRGLNKDFYHKTVNTKDVENYFSKMAKKDFSKVFDQYLRTTQIPKLTYKIKKKKESWLYTLKIKNVVDGFKIEAPVTKGLVKNNNTLLLEKNKSVTIEVPTNTTIDAIINPNLFIEIED